MVKLLFKITIKTLIFTFNNQSVFFQILEKNLKLIYQYLRRHLKVLLKAGTSLSIISIKIIQSMNIAHIEYVPIHENFCNEEKIHRES